MGLNSFAANSTKLELDGSPGITTAHEFRSDPVLRPGSYLIACPSLPLSGIVLQLID